MEILTAENDPMPETTPGFFEAMTGAAAKLWPGLVGSLVALRWLPADATRFDRFIGAIGGFAAAANVGPMIAEFAGVHSQSIEGGIAFIVGLFGMAIAGELMVGLREIRIGQIVGSWIRKILGVREGEGDR